jgi:protein-disulfide isomerase
MQPPIPQPGFFKRWSHLLRWLIVLVFLLFVIFFIWLVKQQVPRTLDLSSFAGNPTSQLSTVESPVDADLSVVDRYEDDPQLGSPDAPITIVAFEDFQCPYCKQAQPDLRTMLQRYGANIHFIYRDFPITTLHPDSVRAAEAAACASDQGQFWGYHDVLFDHQAALSESDLVGYAADLGLDVGIFTQCLQSGQHAAEIQQDFQDGVAAGVTGTPTFFINGNKLPGVVTLSAWEQIVNYLLHGQ